MNRNEQIQRWKEEEQIAHIHGWDFSHIANRSAEQTDFPWDYKAAISRYLTPEKRLLDIDTGGGEFLLSLGHPKKTPPPQRVTHPMWNCANERYCPWVSIFVPVWFPRDCPSRTLLLI